MKKLILFIFILINGLTGNIISENEKNLDNKLIRNKRFREVIHDLLELNTPTRMCGEILVYSLFSFCSNIAEYIEYSKSSNKRQNEVHEYGITDECCYNWCTGYDVLKYCS
jgi:hypothetical protein